MYYNTKLTTIPQSKNHLFSYKLAAFFHFVQGYVLEATQATPQLFRHNPHKLVFQVSPRSSFCNIINVATNCLRQNIFQLPRFLLREMLMSCQ